MKVIQYNRPVDLSIPDMKFGRLARFIFDIVAAQAKDELLSRCAGNETEESKRFREESGTLGEVKAVEGILTDDIADNRVIVADIASKLIENFDFAIDGKPETFETCSVWPSEHNGIKQSVSIPLFLNALIDYSNTNVSISYLRLLQLAEVQAILVSSDTIEDHHVMLALSAYYCSFDERFQAIFYPIDFSLGCASKSAMQFYFSSMLSENCELTKIYNVTPSSVWLMLLVQEPIPSLLYDYLSKIKQTTGVNFDVQSNGNAELAADATTIRELCDYYIDGMFPSVHTDILKIAPSISLMDLVADCIISSGPASVKDVVHMLFLAQGMEEDSFHWWTYCAKAKASCSYEDIPFSYYPNTLVIPENTQNELVKNLGDTSNDIRMLLASAGFFGYLDECLAGGAPDILSVKKEDLSYGGMFLVDQPDKDKISEEDYETIRMSRKLSQFKVPMPFQQLILAHMIARGGAVISPEDIVETVHSSSFGDDTMFMLAGDISPYTSHAGIEDDAASILAAAGIIMQRLSMSLIMDESSSLKMYLSCLATAMSSWSTKISSARCTSSFDWKYSLLSPQFDPRVHVFFNLGTDASLREDGFIALPPEGATSGTTLGYGMKPPSSSGASTSRPTATNAHFAVPLATTSLDSSYTKSTTNPTSRPIAHPILDRFCVNMVEEARAGRIGGNIVGRDETIELIETVLMRRDKSNPLLLAPAGAGKTALAEAIAHRIATGQSKLLAGFEMYSLDITSLGGDGASPAIVIDRMEEIMKEAIATGAILFIDEIHMIVHAGHGEMNLANAMKPYLARSGLKLIGSTTEREFNYTLAKDKALARRFSALHLPPLDFEAVTSILRAKSETYGMYHGVSYDDAIINSIVLLAREYMTGKESPDRELDILDMSASIATRAGDAFVEEAHIVEAVRMLTSNKTVQSQRDLALSVLDNDFSKEHLDELFPNVAGQYRAKEAIVQRISKSKLGLTTRHRPKNVFLFAGNSGVGKTLMARELARYLNQDPDSDVLTIALSEYQDRGSNTKLLGAAPQWVGYNDGGILTNFVRSHPCGIVILDELDKCCSSITNIFLSAFDSGIITAGDGTNVDCHSITFVCTTNEGFNESKRYALGFAASADDTASKETDIAIQSMKERFGAALMSRIDEVIVFEDLTEDDYIEICRISYRQMADKLELRHNIQIADAYSEEHLVEKAKELIKEMDMTKTDARTLWNEIERDIASEAVKLLTQEVDTDE